jgi:hypothetical protein
MLQQLQRLLLMRQLLPPSLVALVHETLLFNQPVAANAASVVAAVAAYVANVEEAYVAAVVSSACCCVHVKVV